jgi:c-di-GMP-binding flagellar brake protein YcgR
VNLRVGQNVRLEVQGEAHVELDGTVLLVGEKELMLNFPRYKVLPFVKAGARAVLRAWDHLGLHQAKVRVTRVTKVPHPGVLVLTVPRSYQTIQKRNYFRLETSLVLGFWVGPAPGPENVTMASRAITDDISAGGVRFKTLQALTLGQLLFMSIDFPRGQRSAAETVSFSAQVVRVTSTTVEDEVQYTVSCQFENVRDRDRDRVVKLLLDLQSKVR